MCTNGAVGSGVSAVMPALSYVAACQALFRNTGKQLSHFEMLRTVLFNPTCISCAAGAHWHAPPCVPAIGWGCHRCSAGLTMQHRAHAHSSGALMGTAMALATLTACGGAEHAMHVLVSCEAPGRRWFLRCRAWEQSKNADGIVRISHHMDRAFSN